MPVLAGGIADADGVYDVICIGGGLGGLAAAATACAAGLRTLVVEASPFAGGCGAYSGGLLWAPGAPDGPVPDTLEAADQYLQYVQGERRSDDRLRREVLRAAREAIEAYVALGVRLEVVPDNPDVFYPEAPGSVASGRMYEAAVEGPSLGDVRTLLSPSPHYRIGLRHSELFGGRLQPEELDDLRRRRTTADHLTMGPGLAGAFLRAAVADGDADLVVGERITRLALDEGAVAGVLVAGSDPGGPPRRITARRGVLIATGGYGWTPEAADLEGLPDFVEAGPPSLRGDHLDFAEQAGVGLVRGAGPQFSMGALLQPEDRHPGTDAPLFTQLFDVMGLPHTLVVNRDGHRFGDESYYVGINSALATWDAERKAWPNFPCFLILDDRYRQRYPLGGLPAGAPYPSTVVCAEDLHGLADMLGIDPEKLTETVDQFNAAAAAGTDSRFGRGEKPFVRRRYGDPCHLPNPNLGPLSVPPFHALPLRLLGTGMCTFGLRTDEHGRVLRRGGAVVPGLYATGNATAATEFRGYITGYANTRNIALAHRSATHMATETATTALAAA